MAALRCIMLVKVGIKTVTVFNNHIHDDHVMRRTNLLGLFLGAVNPTTVNHLLSPPHSYTTTTTTTTTTHTDDGDGDGGEVLISPFSDDDDLQFYPNPNKPTYKGLGLDVLLPDAHDVFYAGLLKHSGSLDDPHIKEPAITAVEQYNKQQNTNLEFVRVVETACQVVCGMMYYITLEAIDHNGVKNTYQAKICLDASKHCAWVLLSFTLAPPDRQPNKPN